jgi:membrane-associated phospholipid phosphatase
VEDDREARAGSGGWRHENRSLVLTRGKAPIGLALATIIATIGWAAAAPGGLKAHQVQLGACGVVLALLGIAWAANRDGLAAVGYDRTAGREWAPLFASRSLARALLLFAGFLALALIVQRPGVQSLDAAFVHRCYQCGGPGLTRAMLHISRAGGGNLLYYGIPLVVLSLWAGGRLRSLRFFVASMFGTFGLEGVFKGLVHRPRPDMVPGSYFNSYPSGHALAATILASVLLAIWLPVCWRLGQRFFLWSAAIVWIGLISASRIYLGTHYPTDVAGGILLGGAWVYFCQGLLLNRSRWSIPREVSSVQGARRQQSAR